VQAPGRSTGGWYVLRSFVLVLDPAEREEEEEEKEDEEEH
jgi:hypothetical protein